MKPKRLIKELQKQLRKDVNNLVVRLKLAAAYHEVGRVGESVELYRSVALAYHESGRPAQAMAVCRSVLELEPGEPQTLQLLAALDQQAQQAQQSQQAQQLQQTQQTPQVSAGQPAPPSLRGPSLLHSSHHAPGAIEESRRASSADLVEERDTAERDKWVPSLAPRPAVPVGEGSARGKSGSFSSPSDEYSMTPTPLPEPLAPHDADRENSVVESSIRRYPLPMELAPGEQLPRVDLPNDLTPVDDDLLPTDEHDSLDIPAPGDLVTSAPPPRALRSEASRPASMAGGVPSPRAGVALYQDDEITELATRDALQRMKEQSLNDGPELQDDDAEARRPTTPLPMQAIPHHQGADETADTGRHRRGEASRQDSAGEIDGDPSFRPVALDDEVSIGRPAGAQQGRIARIAAEIDARVDLGGIGDTVPEPQQVAPSQDVDTDSGVVALDTGDVIIEGEGGRNSNAVADPPDAVADLPGGIVAAAAVAAVVVDDDDDEQVLTESDLEALPESSSDAGSSSPGVWNDEITGRYDGMPEDERADTDPRPGGSQRPAAERQGTAGRAIPSTEQVTRRASAGRFKDPTTTGESPALTLEAARAAMARDAIERSTTEGDEGSEFDDVTEGDAQAFTPVFEADELTATDASASEMSRPRVDGLPVVIHDDMELGDAFHIALGDGEQPLGEVRAPLSIFSSLPREAVSDLAERMVLRHFDPKQFIVREGDASDTCYVIVSGEVVILRNDPIASEPIEVVRLDDGSLFGELALLANRHRRASVRAVNECHAYEIPRRLLRELAASYLEVGPILERIYRDRLLASTVNTAPFLRNLPEVTVNELRDDFQTVRYDIGQPIIREGNRGGGFYLIAVGSVDITRRISEKRSTLISTLDEGAYFADMALIDGDTALVSISAAAPTELISLSPEHFYGIIEKSPGLWRQIRLQGRCPELEENQILSGETYLT